MSIANVGLAVGALMMASVGLVTNPGVADAAKQLVTGKDIKDATITSADVKDHSLLARSFAVGQVPTGPTGPAGPMGTASNVPGQRSSYWAVSNFDDWLGGGYSDPGSWQGWRIAEQAGTLPGDGALVSAEMSFDPSEDLAVDVGVCLVDDAGGESLGVVRAGGPYELGPGRNNSIQVSVWLHDLPAVTFNVLLCITGVTGEDDVPVALDLEDTGHMSGWIAIGVRDPSGA